MERGGRPIETARECMTAIQAASKLKVHHQYLIGYIHGCGLAVDRIGKSYVVTPELLDELRNRIRKSRRAIAK